MKKMDNEKLLISYIGNNYSKIKSKKFSVPSLFFGYLYTGYRKYYLLAFITILIYILRGLISKFFTLNNTTLAIIYVTISVVLNIIVAINFNKWYLKNAEKKVKKIKEDNPDASESELIAICEKKGGTSIVKSILFVIIYAVIFSAIKIIIK